MSLASPLQIYKTVRIAVSGDVPLTRLETLVIDTMAFQRLRGIRQLGTAHLVYPTAVHTRFDHSLGTLAMAGEMMRAIRGNHVNAPEEREISPEQEMLIRLLALLHDITHIPFGHIIEDESRILPRHDRDDERLNFFLGEESRIGALLVRELGTDLYARLMRLFRARRENLAELGEDLFIHDLVNDTVCADLLDYLRRDCYFCNINLDTDYRFLNYLYLRREGGVRRAVIRLWKEGKSAPRRDTLNELIRLLDNRYLMGERVYFHHAKLVAGAMVAGAVSRALRAGELVREDFYRLGDDVLMDRLARSSQPAVARLANAVLERKFWKKAFERTQRDVEAEQERLRAMDVWETIDRQWHGDVDFRMGIENRLAALLGLDEADLLIHCPHSKMAMKFAEMKVFWNGALRSLRECTDDEIVGPKLAILLKSHENLWAMRVHLNPDRLERKDAVAAAVAGAWTQDESERARQEQRLLRQAAGEVARAAGFDQRLIHGEFERKVEQATLDLEQASSGLQDKEQVRRIVGESFSK